MKTTEINNLKNKIAAKKALEAQVAAEKTKEEKLEEALANAKPKTCLDFYKDVKAGIYLPITDENDNIVGINRADIATGIQHAKRIGCHMSVGRTLAEQQEDEIALRVFMVEYAGKPVMDYLNISLQLIEAGLNPEEIVEAYGRYYFVLPSKKCVIDNTGEVVVDLTEELKNEKISNKLVKTILINKVELLVANQ